MGHLLVGIERVTNAIDRCCIYEALYLGPDMGSTSLIVENALIGLYSAILCFLATAKQYYTRNTFRKCFIKCDMETKAVRSFTNSPGFRT